MRQHGRQAISLALSGWLSAVMAYAPHAVTELPLLEQGLSSAMFAGYLDAGETAGYAPKSHHLFYTFVESQDSPSTDPLFLWTNGGPGKG